MSTILIDRVCEIVSAGEMSRAGLARAAGLRPNSLRQLGDADRNPTADRASATPAAIDAAKGPAHIASPGHVFPLVARDGGVLVRAGHTEAAVDVARLAGLNPAGVICEIMSEDGSMARMDDLFAFAQLHGLRIGTIRDLIAYRLRKDRLVAQTAEARFESRWGGTWTAR